MKHHTRDWAEGQADEWVVPPTAAVKTHEAKGVVKQKYEAWGSGRPSPACYIKPKCCHHTGEYRTSQGSEQSSRCPVKSGEKRPGQSRGSLRVSSRWPSSAGWVEKRLTGKANGELKGVHCKAARMLPINRAARMHQT